MNRIKIIQTCLDQQNDDLKSNRERSYLNSYPPTMYPQNLMNMKNMTKSGRLVSPVATGRGLFSPFPPGRPVPPALQPVWSGNRAGPGLCQGAA